MVKKFCQTLSNQLWPCSCKRPTEKHQRRISGFVVKHHESPITTGIYRMLGHKASIAFNNYQLKVRYWNHPTDYCGSCPYMSRPKKTNTLSAQQNGAQLATDLSLFVTLLLNILTFVRNPACVQPYHVTHNYFWHLLAHFSRLLIKKASYLVAYNLGTIPRAPWTKAHTWLTEVHPPAAAPHAAASLPPWRWWLGCFGADGWLGIGVEVKSTNTVDLVTVSAGAFDILPKYNKATVEPHVSL